ncbi:MAG: hypothetical protein P1U67_05200 [Alcanivoracaceae bacterium]|nr:hypothetical protein [Alcanivoracaceae bacterium]
MKRLTTLILLFSLAPGVMAEGMDTRWDELRMEYASAAEKGDFVLAYEIAMELLGIDPSDTDARLSLVLASVSQEKMPPAWVLNEPWAQATAQDRINRVAAQRLLESLNKQRQ